MKKTLVTSQGGGIEFIGLISMLVSLLYKGVKPSIVAGNSSGAIVMFLHVCARLSEGLKLARKSHDIRTIFSRRSSPFGRVRGASIGAIYRFFSGKSYVSKMDNLEKNLRRIVTPKDFLYYRDSLNTPDCYILVTVENTGVPRAINLKERYFEDEVNKKGAESKISYNEAISLVMASASIQPISPSRNFRGLSIQDGGHSEPHPGAEILDITKYKVAFEIEQCISLFSRPEPSSFESKEIGLGKNAVSKILNAFRMQLKQSSIKGEKIERDHCEDNGIEYIPIYLEDFTDNFFRASKSEIVQGEINGIDAVSKYYAG